MNVNIFDKASPVLQDWDCGRAERILAAEHPSHTFGIAYLHPYSPDDGSPATGITVDCFSALWFVF